MGLIEPAFKHIRLSEVCSSALTISRDQAELKEIEIHTNFADELKISVDSSMVEIVIRNILIMVTTLGDEDNVITALQNKAQGYILKPFDQKTLFVAISQCGLELNPK